MVQLALDLSFFLLLAEDKCVKKKMTTLMQVDLLNTEEGEDILESAEVVTSYN